MSVNKRAVRAGAVAFALGVALAGTPAAGVAVAAPSEDDASSVSTSNVTAEAPAGRAGRAARGASRRGVSSSSDPSAFAPAVTTAIPPAVAATSVSSGLRTHRSSRHGRDGRSNASGPRDPARAALIGLTEAAAVEEAESGGWVTRIVARDGENYPATKDYRPERVNLTVDGGIVTSVFAG